jgi:hypothetical protein
VGLLDLLFFSSKENHAETDAIVAQTDPAGDLLTCMLAEQGDEGSNT